MELTLGFSPCPNDTYIFDALVHQKIDTKEYQFKYHLEDVETLNQNALKAKFDITKMSFAASCYIKNNYLLLQSGAALGKGVGPLLISAKPLDWSKTTNVKIAIPGEKTTANFLFNYLVPHTTNKVFMPFHEIENWVLDGKNDENRLGVIIHENRFTYASKGLHKVKDLGEYWEEKTNLPIPLGGIFIKSSFSKKIRNDVDALIKQSLEYAFKNYSKNLPDFVITNAQEMSEEVMWKHIKLYVNEFSLNLGKNGLAAIEKLRSIIMN